MGVAAFFLNRTNRSGILNAGPIGGMEQKGNYKIDARFNKTDLIKRIQQVVKYRDKIVVYNKEIRRFTGLGYGSVDCGYAGSHDPP